MIDHGLQLYLPTRSIMASKCISVCTRYQSPSALRFMLDRGLQEYLQGAVPVVQRYRGNRGGPSDGRYIFGSSLSRNTLSHFHLNLSYNKNTHSIIPKIWSHSLCPRFCGSKQLHGLLMPGSIISSHPIPTLLELEPLCLMTSVPM
jgi:hypothetical protein